MYLLLVEKWDAKLPAEPAREIPGKNGILKFEALPERTVLMGLLEAMDGSKCRAMVELPEGTPKDVKVPSVLQLEVPDFPDSPLRSRRLTRIMDAPKADKAS